MWLIYKFLLPFLSQPRLALACMYLWLAGAGQHTGASFSAGVHLPKAEASFWEVFKQIRLGWVSCRRADRVPVVAVTHWRSASHPQPQNTLTSASRWSSWRRTPAGFWWRWTEPGAVWVGCCRPGTRTATASARSRLGWSRVQWDTAWDTEQRYRFLDGPAAVWVLHHQIKPNLTLTVIYFSICQQILTDIMLHSPADLIVLHYLF